MSNKLILKENPVRSATANEVIDTPRSLVVRNRARTNSRPVSKTPTKAQATRQNVLSQSADDLPSSKSLIEVIF